MQIALGVLALVLTAVFAFTVPPLLLAYAFSMPYLKALAATVFAGMLMGGARK